MRFASLHPIGPRAIRRQAVSLVVAAAAGGVGVAACGGSSHPSYCSDRSQLEQSVKDLSPSGGLSGLRTQLQQIETNAKALVSSAKSDFPNETAAIDSAVSKLKTDLAATGSAPSAAQLATLATDAQAVATAVSDFVKASSSAC